MKLLIFNIHDVALLVTATLCVFLAIFQFCNPRTNRIARYFLLIFLLDIAIGAGSVLMLWQPAIRISPLIDSYVIPYTLFASLLLKGPLLYGYVSAVTTQNYQFEPLDTVHLIPIISYFVVIAITSHHPDNIPVYSDKLTQSLSLYEWHSVKIIPLIYALMAVQKVHQYRRHYRNHSSGTFPGGVWLDILAWGSLFNWGWSLGTHALGFYFGASIADTFGILDNYITSGLISALLAYSIVNINKHLLTNISLRNVSPEINTEICIVEKIVHCLEVEKLFLNPRLNIERMAEHIGVPYREVSALINKHFHTHFNEYINLYRINEAKRLLSDEQLLNLSIHEIYMQAGFNSKSAFHRFFNRLVGLSPTEFRKLSTTSTKKNCPAAV